MINLTGLMAFLPTAFTEDGTIDSAAIERQVEFLIDGGASSVVVAGGVGEFYSLSSIEHRTLLAAAHSAAADRVPVIAGIGHSTAIAADLAAQSSRHGADALMVNPLYFIRPELRGLVEHYRAIGAASDLPLIVFSTEGAVYGPDELEALATVPQVAAVKDEHGDVELFAASKARLGERYTWINGMAEPLAMQYAAAGAQAMTSGLANLDPGLSLGVWDAAVAGDRARFDELMIRAEPLLALRRRRPGYHITVLKEGMALLGRSAPLVRLPLLPLLSDERAELAAMLSDFPTPVAG